MYSFICKKMIMIHSQYTPVKYCKFRNPVCIYCYSFRKMNIRIYLLQFFESDISYKNAIKLEQLFCFVANPCSSEFSIMIKTPDTAVFAQTKS